MTVTSRASTLPNRSPNSTPQTNVAKSSACDDDMNIKCQQRPLFANNMLSSGQAKPVAATLRCDVSGRNGYPSLGGSRLGVPTAGVASTTMACSTSQSTSLSWSTPPQQTPWARRQINTAAHSANVSTDGFNFHQQHQMPPQHAQTYAQMANVPKQTADIRNAAFFKASQLATPWDRILVLCLSLSQDHYPRRTVRTRWIRRYHILYTHSRPLGPSHIRQTNPVTLKMYCQARGLVLGRVVYPHLHRSLDCTRSNLILRNQFSPMWHHH